MPKEPARKKRGRGRPGVDQALNWVDDFLKYFERSGSVRWAAKQTGIAETGVHRLRRTNKEFAARFEAAKEMAIAELSHEAHNRAMNGSDKLIMFLLSRLSHAHRDRREVKTENTHDHRFANMSDEQLDEEVKRLQKSVAEAEI